MKELEQIWDAIKTRGVFAGLMTVCYDAPTLVKGWGWRFELNGGDHYEIKWQNRLIGWVGVDLDWLELRADAPVEARSLLKEVSGLVPEDEQVGA